MLKNYLKIALRNLRKHKGYSFINIAGLTIGMAACVLILLYVQDELSYDRYHDNAEAVYRVNLKGAVGGSFIHTASSSAPMAATLVQEYPEVLNAVRFLGVGRPLVAYEEHRFYEDNVFWADSTVFDVFTFPLVQGDPRTALTEPNTVVLTEAMAQKYFGDDDPVGQTLRFDGDTDYTVTGVLKNLPATSHFPIDFLLSMTTVRRSTSDNWVSNSFYTYILLPAGHDPVAVEAKFPDLIKKYVAPQIEQALGQTFEEALAAGLEWAYELQPLTRIYLHSEGLESDVAPMSDAGAVYILSVIAALILLIACFNFMNLATARSANRAKEVGMRKVMGSARQQLVGQFLGESVLMAVIGGLLAFVAIQAVLPFFNNLAGKTLSLGGGGLVEVLGGLIGIALAAGLLAGIYPALVLSRFQPAAVLKGVLGAGAKSTSMRSVLVVLQFAASIVLLVGTGIVFTQLDFMLHKNLGFAQEQVVVLPIETDAGRQGFEAFRNELLAQPNVVQVAAAEDMPGRLQDINVFRPEDAPNEVVYPTWTSRVSHDFPEALEIETVAGRTFSRAFTTDESDAVVINEAAAKLMGFESSEAAVGKSLAEIGNGQDGGDIPFTIVGVVKDFHFESLHEPIKALAMTIEPEEFRNVVVRIRPEQMPETLAMLQQKWEAYEPGHPYRYHFLDADFGRAYEKDRRLGMIFGYFAALAIFIACLGLFGLASFITEQRTKEIGVRKVLGASVGGIVVLLSKEFTKLVGIAFIVAAPLAYFAMDRWLSAFAYQVDLAWWIFLGAGVTALAIAWLTVSYQSIRAALTNPVEALRYE